MLPTIAMQKAIELGEEPIFFSINESDCIIPKIYLDKNVPIYITQFGKLIKLCKKHSISRLILLGKVNKDTLFKNFKFDITTILLLAKMKNKNDYSMFEVVANELSKHNITILSQKTFIKNLFLPSGRYTKKKLSSKNIKDINFGMIHAREIAKLNIGQTIVVLNQSVLSVEAIEGTDETILRAGNYCGKYHPTVCKTAKKNQDERFDLPTLGEDTLESLKKANCNTLAFESKNTIIVEPKKFIETAEKLQINLISCNETLDNVNEFRVYGTN